MKLDGDSRTTSVYNGANRIAWSQDGSGRTTITYDADGNLTKEVKPSSQITTSVWDAESMNDAVLLPDTTRVTYTYNADHLRVRKETAAGTRKYVFDLQNPFTETDGSDVTQAVYVVEPQAYGNIVSQRQLVGGIWNSVYYHFDALGSSDSLTDSMAVVTDTYTYTAFGETKASTGTTTNVYTWVGELGYFRDVETGSYNLHERPYQPAWARMKSSDPLGLEEDSNEYRIVGNNPVNAVDPSGFGKGKVVGWVVRRVGRQLVKVQVVMTEKQAARLFLTKCAREGLDILVREGRQQAHTIANIIRQRLGKEGAHDAGRILEGGNHLGHTIRNQVGEVIGRGMPHIQFDGIDGRHIFYASLAAIVSSLSTDAEADSSDDSDYQIDIAEVYSDPVPGPTVFRVLTVEHWAGEDSWLSYVDWVNPLEILAIGADVGRMIDREVGKKLIGYIITISEKGGGPVRSFTIDPDGGLVSTSIWKDGDVAAVIGGEDYLRDMDEESKCKCKQ